MRLLEAIVAANHRALAGDAQAGLRPADYAGVLPLVALTCIDPRLNPLLPEVLGLPEDQFIWLRNAGNIITNPLSGTMRSLALACAIKGGREIAILGHSDCQVRKTTLLELGQRFAALGVDRARLPDNLTEYFGLFASERQNVMRGVELARASPLIGPQVPVHGLLVDIESGRLEWVVNGYESLARARPAQGPGADAPDRLRELAPFELGGLKFPEGRIGELAARAGHGLEKAGQAAEAAGAFAEKIGELATRAGEWLTQSHPPAGPPPPPAEPKLKLAAEPPKPPAKPPPLIPPGKLRPGKPPR